MPLTPTTVGDGLLSSYDVTVGTCLQTAYGSINASPVFETVRRKSGSTSKKINYTASEEIIAGYQGVQQIQDTIDLSFTVEGETTKQSIQFLKEAL